MLAFTRRPGEFILLYPSQDIDPNMTVAELFSEGPVEVIFSEMKNGQIRVAVDAPDNLVVVRNEIN
jgi:sRNA-binding carbon storage regulator CsrA